MIETSITEKRIRAKSYNVKNFNEQISLLTSHQYARLTRVINDCPAIFYIREQFVSICS